MSREKREVLEDIEKAFFTRSFDATRLPINPNRAPRKTPDYEKMGLLISAKSPHL